MTYYMVMISNMMMIVISHYYYTILVILLLIIWLYMIVFNISLIVMIIIIPMLPDTSIRNRSAAIFGANLQLFLGPFLQGCYVPFNGTLTRRSFQFSACRTSQHLRAIGGA